MIGIFGYRWIHAVMQATAIIVGVALVIMFTQGLRYGALPARETTLARPGFGLFLGGVALLVIDMLSFGPFVSDYTRCLPAATNGRRLFWGIYTGSVLATLGSCAVGAYLAAPLVIFIPWSAVNLADYFLVRRGRYDVASFFTADGAYGQFAWRGLLAYAIGLATEWPFVSQPDYTGPLVSTLGGADISWLAGWFAAAIAYLVLIALTPGSPRHQRPIVTTAR